MELIGIVDSGSTKADWIFVNLKGKEQLRTKTIGLNPLLLNAEKIKKTVQTHADVSHIAAQVVQIYFYGAGVKNSTLKEIIKNGLKTIFPQAKITASSDMHAAAYAAYQGEPCMVCILGTGSNACYFDGTQMVQEVPSLGYVLGDEGSGNHLGRMLLKAYYSKQLPQHLCKALENSFKVDLNQVLQNIYQEPFPNAYLATFSTFLIEHQKEAFVQDLIRKSFNDFIIYQVLPYPQAKNTALQFIGSIAFHYQDILMDVVKSNGLYFGGVIQKPIDALVAYHQKFVF